MSLIPPALTQAQLDQHFPLSRATIAPTTFEIGLALAGTVSAGSYTAGVIDYLLEALDAWSAAKVLGDPDAPTHNVGLSTVAGASGGAINGAVLLRAASFDYPHGANNGNPFFNAWAGPDCVTLEQMLAPGLSESGTPAMAFLNTSPVEQQAKAILKFTGSDPRSRPYLTNPLRLIATIGNLTGVPYRIDYRGDTGLGLDMNMHSDYVRFALSVELGCPRPDNAPRNDEYALSASSQLNWNFLGSAALATSAFPIAFNARSVDRTVDQLAYRAVLIPGADGDPDRVVPVVPLWRQFSNLLQLGKMTATAVDGGTMDNEPIGIVRQELAGLAGRNPRTADKAHRAVILIDPFADAKTLATPPESLFDISGQVLNLFLEQARYKPEDLALAQDETKFSRFLIAPRASAASQQNVSLEGSGALAGGGLGGFLGFIDQRFLQHDFELGRYNAFLFLTRDFRVPDTNVVIAAHPWTDEQKRTYTTGPMYDYQGQPADERDYLPLIPLMANLRQRPPQAPVRPRLDSVPQTLGDAIDGRLDFVFGRLFEDVTSVWPGLTGSVARAGLKTAWGLWGRKTAREKVMDILQKALNPQ